MTDQPVTNIFSFYGHNKGDRECLECHVMGSENQPLVHKACGGLVHFHLSCYEHTDYYSMCDKCGKEWPDWDDVKRENA
jgi:hypothetical protein